MNYHSTSSGITYTTFSLSKRICEYELSLKTQDQWIEIADSTLISTIAITHTLDL